MILKKFTPSKLQQRHDLGFDVVPLTISSHKTTYVADSTLSNGPNQMGPTGFYHHPMPHIPSIVEPFVVRHPFLSATLSSPLFVAVIFMRSHTSTTKTITVSSYVTYS